MKRGLIEWDRAQLPGAEFQERLNQAQRAMGASDLDYLLIYADVDQAGAARFFTNYVPYWGNALLIIPAAGAPVLVTSLSKRVHQWIKEVSLLTDVRSSPDLARAAGNVITEQGVTRGAIGLAEAGAIPFSLRESLENIMSGFQFTDATQLVRQLRKVYGPAALSVVRKATQIAFQALEELGPEAGTLSLQEISARAERFARLHAAEDVDVMAWNKGPLKMRLSVQYCGYWARAGRALDAASSGRELAQKLARLFKPGVSSRQLEKEIIASLGAKEGTAHLEHMCGAFPFEPMGPKAILESGMVVSATVRGPHFLADTFLIKEGGGESLSG